ncbi:MAG: GGDEF domain-containing protein [Coriobacteriia bacterium]|nr:GGDEF domain-containing protein [Coriobacteriia bacterium]
MDRTVRRALVGAFFVSMGVLLAESALVVANYFQMEQAMVAADLVKCLLAPAVPCLLALAASLERRLFPTVVILSANAALQLGRLAFVSDLPASVHDGPWFLATALPLAAAFVLLAVELYLAGKERGCPRGTSVFMLMLVAFACLVMPLVSVDLHITGLTLTAVSGLLLSYGTYFAVADAVLALDRSQQESVDWERINQALTRDYVTCHLIDLPQDSIRTVTSTDLVEELLAQEEGVSAKFRRVMVELVTEYYLDKMLLFVDFETLGDRLRGRSSISFDFEGRVSGWCRASFHVLRADRWGNPVELAFMVISIDEQKRNEAELLAKSTVDSLTGLHNQRAFHDERASWEGKELPAELAVVSLDANELKSVNDTFGHDAGDDLLRDMGGLIKEAFGAKGTCFRTGGDEFCVVARATSQELQECGERLNELAAGWKHDKVKSMAVSWGFAVAGENPGVDFAQLCRESDQRMYAAKRAYYEQKGIDRRRR